jgi:hypothetical protein
VMTSVHVIHVNPREENNIKDDDNSYGFCCSTRVSNLVEYMKSETNALHNFGAFFLWDVRLRQDHGVLLFLMIHEGLGACDDARVENLGLKDSNPMMDM